MEAQSAVRGSDTRMGVQMTRKRVFLLIAMVVCEARAAEPSRNAIISCLSASSTSASVKWRALPTEEINSQDAYRDGYDATFYIIEAGMEIGYAEQGAAKGIIFDSKIYPLTGARALVGFSVRPTELNPYTAEWGMVTDASGKYLCVSFPFGGLGQSGTFQKNRSAYLMPFVAANKPRVLYYATGNLELIRTRK